MGGLDKKTELPSVPTAEQVAAIPKPAQPAERGPHPAIILGICPWVDWFAQRYGWKESNPAQNKLLSKGWKYVKLAFTTITGSSHAWCAMSANSALIETGYLSTGSAAAVSFRKLGNPCQYVYGAFLPITHKSGQHHITIFLGWKDDLKRIAYCLGGNQADSITVSEYNLSGNASGHDEAIPGPRWPLRK